MDKRQQGFVLERPLNLEGKEDINIRIMEVEAKLMKLLAMRQAGKTTVRVRKRVVQIDGIGIKYAQTGGNKLIAYEAENNPENYRDFKDKVSRIFRALEKGGYKPMLCKEVVKVEVNGGARCLI